VWFGAKAVEKCSIQGPVFGDPTIGISLSTQDEENEEEDEEEDATGTFWALVIDIGYIRFMHLLSMKNKSENPECGEPSNDKTNHPQNHNKWMV